MLALPRREIGSLVTGSPKFPHEHTPHTPGKQLKRCCAALTRSAQVPDPCRMRAMVCFQAETPLTSLGFLWICLSPDRKDFTTKETMALVNTLNQAGATCWQPPLVGISERTNCVPGSQKGGILGGDFRQEMQIPGVVQKG